MERKWYKLTQNKNYDDIIVSFCSDCINHRVQEIQLVPLNEKNLQSYMLCLNHYCCRMAHITTTNNQVVVQEFNPACYFQSVGRGRRLCSHHDYTDVCEKAVDPSLF